MGPVVAEYLSGLPVDCQVSDNKVPRLVRQWIQNMTKRWADDTISEQGTSSPTRLLEEVDREFS